MASAPGKPKLTVVGYASSIGAGDEAAWVAPGQVAALRPAGGPGAAADALHLLARAGTAAQVSGDLGRAEARAAGRGRGSRAGCPGCPPTSLIAASQGINTPFVVALAVIGLVLAVLITASVVAAAGDRQLPADRRAQVHRVHPRPGHHHLPGPDQPARPRRGGRGHRARGRLEGAAGLVNGGNTLFHINVTIPLWINILVPRGDAGADRGLAAAVPALRAGQLSAVAGDHGAGRPRRPATDMPPTGSGPPGCRCPGR